MSPAAGGAGAGLASLQPLRVCVFGAGAVGGHLAARLAGAGHAVSVVARGAALAAIRERGGITLLAGGEALHARVRAAADAAELGAQDLVVVALKAHAVAGAATALAPLLHAGTLVVFAQNGIPWWYDGSPAPAAPALQALRDAGHAVAAVIRSSNTVTEPGTVVNESPGHNALLVAELDDADSPRVRKLRALLEGAGVASPPVASIRRAVWHKLLLNLAGSPLCALTGGPAGVIADDPALGRVFETLLREGLAIAAAQGHHFGPDAVDPAALRASSRGSPHKPSMLQDLQAGRALETDAILRAPQAFARAAGVPTPVLDTVLALLDRAVMDRAVMDRAVIDRAVMDRAVIDRAVTDRAVADRR